jgi:hypothetical protein
MMLDHSAVVSFSYYTFILLLNIYFCCVTVPSTGGPMGHSLGCNGNVPSMSFLCEK